MRGTRLFDDTSERRHDEEREIRSLLAKARAEAEAQLGSPIGQQVWNYLKCTFGGDLTDREEAEGFVTFLHLHIGLLEVFRDSLGSQTPRAKTSISERRPPTPQARARRTELIWFVAERVLPFLEFREGKLATRFKRGPRSAGQAGPWDQLCAEWNRLHPAEQKNSGETFRREYHDAITDRHVTEALLEDLKRRQVISLLRRSCLALPAATPAALGRICLLEFPSVRANPPADIREVLARAKYEPAKVQELLGIREEEMRAKAEAVKEYLHVHATREDRLAHAALDPNVADYPLLTAGAQEPKLALCGACLRPYVVGE